MSFRCRACGIIGQRPVLFVIERREKTYQPRTKAHRELTRKVVRQIADPDHDPTFDPGGIGYETVREEPWCAGCSNT